MGNPGKAGGGGICRNDRGDFIFGFAAGYGVLSNTGAKVRAVHDGLLHCLKRGLAKIIIESDSLQVVNALIGKSSIGWKWQNWCKRIKGLIALGQVRVQHTHREGNGPVDALTRLGSSLQLSATFLARSNLPWVVRGQIFLDKLGLGAVKA
ncbi:uncharacterized protein LOC131230428 [Magnolia sinica]|uniref:uncharacterized protein LOC131230428 n=1 Tax=Magnolia sinica TaxID=86752 RepID=UPI00265B0956|nr:uncharacterized protein LOC131230428 [Magnolia sinica]